MQLSEPLLTVIITLRSAKHYDMVSRLRNRLLDKDIPEAVKFMVVDDGSSEETVPLIKSTCADLGFEYVRYESGKSHFCASSARNVGAMAARSPYIMHEDVDLFPYSGYYRDLLDEIEIQRLDSNFKRFLAVPCLYLSETATDLATSGKISKNEILHSHLTGGNLITTALPASSAILVNRLYYLSIGGYNEKFNGWGLEDLEYAFRLTRGLNQFMEPKDPLWLVEAGYGHTSAYRSWRAQFRLHGELLSRKGIVIFHAHHPKDPAWRNPEAHAKNKELFNSEVQAFERTGHSLPSLPAPEKGKSLIFGRGTFAYNPPLLPLWGELEVKGYQAFSDINVADYCKANHINRVIFTNPYASEQRLQVYNAVREAGIPFVVVERGALPDSMFIDDTGFCCESTRYRREHWPTALDEHRLRRVNDYIASQTSSSLALERQGERLGRRAALQKLGIPDSKKVLFVPFQSRSDTTVTYFAGAIGSFDNFVSLVREVTALLPKDWIVIFKKHPLSSVNEEVPGAKDIGDMHINDALEVADYVLLMNSGVGVLSAMFGKPVIHTAQAFYSDISLNRAASTPEEVLSILSTGFEVDQEARLRFFSYLIEDFYSFGKFTVRERKHTDNAMLTITENIDYYRINFLGTRVLDIEPNGRVLNHKAPVYDIYREWIVSKRHNDQVVVHTRPVAKQPPRPPRTTLAKYRRPLVPVVRVFVSKIGNKKDVREFNDDPSGFFAKLRNPWYRGVGAVLFPPGR